MKRFGGYVRMAVALVALVVTTGRIVVPPAFAAPQTPPAIEQLHAVDGGSGLGPKRLPRWPGGGRTMRIK